LTTRRSLPFARTALRRRSARACGAREMNGLSYFGFDRFVAAFSEN
jgi:hypothetical protein